MKDYSTRPAFLRRVLLSAAVPAASTVIYAMQLVLSGKESWAHAFAQEAVFSGTWWFLGVLIFRLCGWLHREPYSISRVVLGLLAGSVGVLILPAVPYHRG